MKQITPKKVSIGGVDYYITPFPAFYATNLSGDVSAVAVPVLSGLLPLFSSEVKDLSEIDFEKVLPPLAKALSELNGDKVEDLMRKLLINKGNIAYEMTDEEGKQVQDRLTYDSANEIFCQNVFDMYKLAWEVINLNYGGFFGKAPSLFGDQGKVIKVKKK